MYHGTLQLMPTEMKSGNIERHTHTHSAHTKYKKEMVKFTLGYAKIVPGASETEPHTHTQWDRQNAKLQLRFLNTKKCICDVLLSLHLFNMKRNALKCQFAFSTWNIEMWECALLVLLQLFCIRKWLMKRKTYQPLCADVRLSCCICKNANAWMLHLLRSIILSDCICALCM